VYNIVLNTCIIY